MKVRIAHRDWANESGRKTCGRGKFSRKMQVGPDSDEVVTYTVVHVMAPQCEIGNVAWYRKSI